MTTTTSYSNRSRFWAIYRSALRSHIPLLIILIIVLTVIIFLPFLVDLLEVLRSGGAGYWAHGREDLAGYGLYYDYTISGLTTFALSAAAVACALFSTSYLHDRRRVDLYHALPLPRPWLLGANMLASCTVMLVAYTGVCAATMLLQLPVYCRYGVVAPGGLLAAAGVAAAAAGLLFTARALAPRLGKRGWTVWAGGAALLAGCAALLGLLLRGTFLGGYLAAILADLTLMAACVLTVYLFTVLIAVNVGTLFDAFAAAVSLGFAPMTIYVICSYVWSDAMYGSYYTPGLSTLLLSPFTFGYYRYALLWGDTCNPSGLALFLLGSFAAAGVFCAGAVLSYRRRKSEVAGMTQQGGFLQTLVKCFAAYLGAVLFFIIFRQYSSPAVALAMFCGAVLAGLVAELILSRGIRHLRSNLKWLAGTGAVCGLLLLAVTADLTGYQTRVPEARQVQEVRVDYAGRFDDLFASRYIAYEDYRENRHHTPVLTDPESIGLVIAAHEENLRDVERSRAYSEDTVSPYLTLDYRLSSGASLERYYPIMDGEAYGLLTQLETRPDYLRSIHPLFRNQGQEIPQAEMVQQLLYYDVLGTGPYALVLDSGGKERLLEALRQDMLDETPEEIAWATRPAFGYLKIGYQYPMYDEAGRHTSLTYEVDVKVLITAEYERTIQLLQDLGVAPDMFLGPVSFEGAYLSPLYLNRNGGRRVNAVDPDSPWTYASRQEGPDRTALDVEDPSLAARLFEQARNQALFSGSWSWDEEYVGISFLVAGRSDNLLFLRRSDLPEEILARLDGE